jgi:hypothetical protein
MEMPDNKKVNPEECRNEDEISYEDGSSNSGVEYDQEMSTANGTQPGPLDQSENITQNGTDSVYSSMLNAGLGLKTEDKTNPILSFFNAIKKKRLAPVVTKGP